MSDYKDISILNMIFWCSCNLLHPSSPWLLWFYVRNYKLSIYSFCIRMCCPEVGTVLFELCKCLLIIVKNISYLKLFRIKNKNLCIIFLVTVDNIKQIGPNLDDGGWWWCLCYICRHDLWYGRFFGVGQLRRIQRSSFRTADLRICQNYTFPNDQGETSLGQSKISILLKNFNSSFICSLDMELCSVWVFWLWNIYR